MPKPTSLSLILPETELAQLEKVLHAFGSQVTLHYRLKLIFQAAQGACLLTLRAKHGHHNQARHSASCGVAWKDYVAKEFGFSDDKASRLMNRWRAVEPLLKKLPAKDQQLVADFLRRPMLPLTDAQIKALEKVTHKIATLQEEIADLEESKLLRNRKPVTNANPANNGSANEAEEDAPAETLFQDQLFLRIVGGGDGTRKTIWAELDDLFADWNKKIKVGQEAVPLWQHGPKGKLTKVLRALEAQREVTVQKFDHMIAEAKEALREK